MAGHNEPDVAKLLKTLESAPDSFSAFIAPTKRLFTANQQLIVDLYIETAKRRGKGSGAASYGTFLLTARSINDLLAGFHLACAGYIPQAYSVQKPILESLDLITLFQEAQEWAEVWADGGLKAYNELKPSMVRKKLGRPGYDEIYGHFCDSGGHPTFSSGKGMSGMTIKDQARTVHMVIGGMHNHDGETQMIILFGFCFFLQLSLLHKLSSMSFNFVPTEELIDRISQLVKNFEEFMTLVKPHFVDRGANPEPLEKLFDEVGSFFESGESEIREAV